MTLAVGIMQPRKRQEVDDLRRAVKPYGVNFTFQIGGFRVEDVPAPPHLFYRDFDRFLADVDREGPVLDIVALEVDTHALFLGDSIAHLGENVALLLGPNTGTLTRDVLDRVGRVIQVETPDHAALNSAIAAAIVLHDRYVTVSHEKGQVA